MDDCGIYIQLKKSKPFEESKGFMIETKTNECPLIAGRDSEKKISWLLCEGSRFGFT